MYLNQMSLQQNQHEQDSQQHQQVDPYSIATLQQQQQQVLANQQAAIYGSSTNDGFSSGMLDAPQQQGHGSSFSQGVNGFGLSNAAPTIGGLLAPSRNQQHARAVSLPAFSQENFANGGNQSQQHQQQQQQLRMQQSSQQQYSHRHQLSSVSGLGFGVWAEESVRAQ